MRERSETVEGQHFPVLEVSRGDQRLVQVSREPRKKTAVYAVVVFDPEAVTESKMRIGDSWAKAKTRKELGICKPGREEDVGLALCRSETISNLNYVFAGEWDGPEDELPPAKALRAFTLKEIRWFSAPPLQTRNEKELLSFEYWKGNCDPIEPLESDVLDRENETYQYEFKVKCYADEQYTEDGKMIFAYSFQRQAKSPFWGPLLKGWDFAQAPSFGPTLYDCSGPFITLSFRDRAYTLPCRPPAQFSDLSGRLLKQVAENARRWLPALRQDSKKSWKAFLKTAPGCRYYRSGDERLVPSRSAKSKPFAALAHCS